MKFSLTRWQQNVLLASCAWALGVTIYMRYQEMPKAQEYATREYYVCAERQAAGIQTDKCLEKVDDDWDDWMRRQWGKIAAVALVPVGASWAAIFAGLYVYRRVKGESGRPDAGEPQ